MPILTNVQLKAGRARLNNDDLDARVWTLVRAIASNCKWCPRRGTASCTICDCSQAVSLVAECDRRTPPEVRAAETSGRTRESTRLRRAGALQKIPRDRFVHPSDLGYAPWADSKTRANDLRALRNAGLVEAKRINARDFTYRRTGRADVA